MSGTQHNEKEKAMANGNTGRAERYPRVKDWKAYRENFDAIFRKKTPKAKKKAKSWKKPE